MIAFQVNGKRAEFAGDPEMPLLWWLRDHAGLTGAKYGCGVGACGACTVLVDGESLRSCAAPVSAMQGRTITTIEGLSKEGALHPLQKAWIEEDVSQCGYCQVGQIMAAAALLKRNPKPADDEISAIGNLCRCGTYPRIRKAIRRASGQAV